jgi:hypothetical protein
MRTNLWLAALAALAIPVTVAANSGISWSLSLNPSLELIAPAKRAAVPDAAATGSPPVLRRLASTTLLMDDRRSDIRVYRPRVYRRPRGMIPVAAQVHIGFFDPIDNFSTGFDGGFRIGPQPDPHIQFGMAMDWWHRSDDKVLDLGTVRSPGGTASEQLILSETTANLIPILVFVQVSGDEDMAVVPFAGLGIGYEWLFLSADDYVTHESFDQTFGGFGWQLWAGAALPLDRRMRLGAEAFYNGCEAGSEVDVYIEHYGPATVRDVIKMNGFGMRLGVSWGF